MSIVVQSLSYIHPDRECLFQHINLSVAKGEKASLTGNNGVGKSTLMQLMAGILLPTEGEITVTGKRYYVPQHFGQYDDCSIAAALGVDAKLLALQAILEGDVSAQHLACLDDDWDLEERVRTALSYWEMQHIALSQPLRSLSGGEKTKVFLAGILIHAPSVVLLDEPSNHLDLESRRLLYEFITKSKSTFLIVSHDRSLLNRMDTTLELSRSAIEAYGGNYDFYEEQKRMERSALDQDIKSREKALRKAKEIEREAIERQQKRNAGGKKKQEKAGMPKVVMDSMKDGAEKSTSRLKSIHAGKTDALSQEVKQLRKELPGMEQMKLGFESSGLHKRKMLITATGINFGYANEVLWAQPLSFRITSGERIALKGGNGSGKTTLLKLILGELQPQTGTIERAEMQTLYIDQDYSLIDNRLSVYEQAQKYNTSAFPEHEVKTRLTRFLFTRDFWDKPCQTLSGGERMRLILCCLAIRNQAPDMIILDEPTNNLDIQNTDILTTAVKDYQGTLLVVSHDVCFLEQIAVEREMNIFPAPF